MDKSDGINELAAALAKAQGEFPEIRKDRTVKVPTKTGKEYEYAYATLSAIRSAVQPALSKNQLAVTQVIQEIEKDSFLETRLLHASGQQVISRIYINTDQAPQALGSQLTYLRRYSLSAILGVVGEEDDDAQIAQADYKPREKNLGTQPPKQVGGAQPSPLSDEEKASRKVTENQVKRLYAILGGAQRDNRWDEGSAKNFLKQASGLDSFLDLNMKQYDWFCHQLEKSDYNKAMAALANIQMKKQPAPSEREPGDDSDESFQNYR